MFPWYYMHSDACRKHTMVCYPSLNMYIYICVCVCVHVYICVCACVCMYVCMYMYIDSDSLFSLFVVNDLIIFNIVGYVSINLWSHSLETMRQRGVETRQQGVVMRHCEGCNATLRGWGIVMWYWEEGLLYNIRDDRLFFGIKRFSMS